MAARTVVSQMKDIHPYLIPIMISLMMTNTIRGYKARTKRSIFTSLSDVQPYTSLRLNIAVACLVCMLSSVLSETTMGATMPILLSVFLLLPYCLAQEPLTYDQIIITSRCRARCVNTVSVHFFDMNF